MLREMEHLSIAEQAREREKSRFFVKVNLVTIEMKEKKKILFMKPVQCKKKKGGKDDRDPFLYR
jgi:predicted Zn-ribbon and HTH transcriptional regulator